MPDRADAPIVPVAHLYGPGRSPGRDSSSEPLRGPDQRSSPGAPAVTRPQKPQLDLDSRHLPLTVLLRARRPGQSP
jgi:hypothetical protein